MTSRRSAVAAAVPRGLAVALAVALPVALAVGLAACQGSIDPGGGGAPAPFADLAATVFDSDGGVVGVTDGPPAPVGDTAAPPDDLTLLPVPDLALPPDGVRVHLARTFPGTSAISFGVPVPPGKVADVATVRVLVGGVPVDGAATRPLLSFHDKVGAPLGVRALLVQLPAAAMPAATLDVDVLWNAMGSAPGGVTVAFATTSADSPEVVHTSVRTIQKTGATYQLVETTKADRTLFTGREPRVLATFPPGYLAGTGILGQQTTALALAADANLAGVRYLSDQLAPFALSAMYAESYRVNPDPESILDPVVNYEGWLYDRCATFLSVHSHTGDARFLRHALRTCSYYAGKITLAGPTAGIFTGKPDADPKYSHLRGLYVYYALTGDEAARAAGVAIADMWLADTTFVIPYRAGKIRGPDKLWTERLLGTSLEALYYGHRLTGDPKYLVAFGEMFATAYRHITTASQSELDAITQDTFPPQNCFIHSALQHSEGTADAPWCSGWMTELLIDPLLRYQEQTGDDRVDEVFVRLARFLRDVGSSYFVANPIVDTFLAPKTCYDKTKGEDVRRLIPLYGAGKKSDGTRVDEGEFDDNEHCADATGLTAAALRALKHQGKYDQGGPIGPFPSEGAALLQLHHEFSACAQLTFNYWTRPRRDPAAWKSAELAAGAADPVTFIRLNKIGYPSHPTTPLRKLSWWFNQSLLQYGLLVEAGVAVPKLVAGKVQPNGCK